MSSLIMLWVGSGFCVFQILAGTLRIGENLEIDAYCTFGFSLEFELWVNWVKLSEF